jgi:hypothetical protein
MSLGEGNYQHERHPISQRIEQSCLMGQRVDQQLHQPELVLVSQPVVLNLTPQEMDLLPGLILNLLGTPRLQQFLR